MVSEKIRQQFIPLLLALLTLAVYAPMLRHGFVNYDDYQYVVDNLRINGGLSSGNIRWAFTAIHQANWHPLTWLSHMLDVELFGLNPAGHHLTSLLLHTANTLLLNRFLLKSTGSRWKSACVAALFAIHPLHVESVAWVAERKDLLSGFFFMTTLLAYERYCRSTTAASYLLILGSFSLGLMCKPMLVTLPCLLLLLDFWPAGRLCRQSLPRLLLEKLPLLVLSAISCRITWIAQQSGIPNPTIPLELKLAGAVTAYATYLADMVWPSRLAVLYPFDHAIPQWKPAVSALVLATITAAVLQRSRTSPYLPVGWLWYLGTLVPVIGLVTVGYQSSADRYTYLPLTGIFIIIAWGVADLSTALKPGKTVVALAAALVIAGLAVTCRWQLGFWSDSISLFSRAVSVTDNNFVAWNNLGAAYQTAGKPDEAIGAYQKSLGINPAQAPPHNNIGLILAKRGSLDEAIPHYVTALSLAPDFREAGCNLGIALLRMGKLGEAVRRFAAVVRLHPQAPLERFEAGLRLIRQGRYAEATALFDEAVRRDPLHGGAYAELGALLVRFGRE